MEIEAIPDARLSKVLDDMMPTKLSWRAGSYEKGHWVFWSQEASNNWTFQERIVTALCSIFPYKALIQFWAAEMIGGRRYFTTTLQPFSLNIPRIMIKKIIHYRKNCVATDVTVEDDENNMDGIIGRVFRNQLPEESSNLRYYSVTDYPKRDLALSCGFKSTLAIPVFEPPKQCCVGVLELLFMGNISNNGMNLILSKFTIALKSQDLDTVDVWKIHDQVSLVKNVREDYEVKQIAAALDIVCKKHKIPLAYGWVRCSYDNYVNANGCSCKSYNDVHVSCEGELLVINPGISFPPSLSLIWQDGRTNDIVLKVGQGLVGKAVLYRKCYVCRDVCQLSITEYPLVHRARMLELAFCFAVCLGTISFRGRGYVIEFFLPKDNTYVENLHRFLSSILITLKQHFISIGEGTQDLGNELIIEVDKLSFHEELPTVNTQSEFEGLQYGEVLQLDHSIDQQLVREDINVFEQPEIALNSEKKSSYSRKDFEQHFGKKLTDVAEIFGVSRSTFKRLCREHNIKRWPSYKRSKHCSLSSTHLQKNVISQGNVELISQHVGRDLLCSEPAPNLGLMSDTNKITVKATYGEKLFMFKLPYSSRMEDLVKKVIDRTKLGEGTFDITYLDEENDRISFACDEDLHDYMEGKSTIRLQIEPIATISPLNLVRSKSQHFSTPSNFIDQFPCHMHDYIENITDVTGDGHCGFRAVAGVLGLSTDEWGSVRALLWKELNSHKELYTKVFIERGRVEQVLASLKFYNSPAPKEYWFELPEMGYLVASVYNVALVCLNKQTSFTYLPLRTSRPNNSKLISIGFVNNDHYVQLMLRENTPLPPVPANWYSHRHSCAAAWLDYYSGRLEMYKINGRLCHKSDQQDRASRWDV